MSDPRSRDELNRHRFAITLACGVVGLIAAGALVKSREAGLSVPDWPLSYGGVNPPRWWEIANVRAEHGHRLIAGTIALATFVLAFWTWRREERRWVRNLAWGAFGAVLLQALLGGITVLFFLPPAISISHAALAELFLCMVISVGAVTSRWWHDAPRAEGPTVGRTGQVALATTVAIFGQILLGAVVRHGDAGLAIPDFPLVFGGLLPPEWTPAIAIHFAHRVGAGLVAVLIIGVLREVHASGAGIGPARTASFFLAGLVLIQIGLGGAVVLTGRAIVPNTIHVATGATLLALSMLVTLATCRMAAVTQQARVALDSVRTTAPSPGEA